MSLELITQIQIDGNPENVWQVLSNFQSYPEWNPFVKSLKGEVKVGNTIEVDLPGMKFKPEVLVFSHNRQFKWKGKLIFKGLFDGEHSFKLEENQDGTTNFIHSEKFSGFLVPLFKKKLMHETKNGFEEMNLALKERVESANK